MDILTPMKLLRWFWHWCRQGLKLLLFGSAAALMATAVCYWPAWLWESYHDRILNLGAIDNWIYHSVRLILFLIWLSIFAATFAPQLKAHPLISLTPRKKAPDESE